MPSKANDDFDAARVEFTHATAGMSEQEIKLEVDGLVREARAADAARYGMTATELDALDDALSVVIMADRSIGEYITDRAEGFVAALAGLEPPLAVVPLRAAREPAGAGLDARIRQRQSLYRLAFDDKRVTRAMLRAQAEVFEDYLIGLEDAALAASPAEPPDPCPHCDMEHVWPCPTIPRCDEPGCERETTCGFPTDAGYRRTCGEHYRAATEPSAGVVTRPLALAILLAVVVSGATSRAAHEIGSPDGSMSLSAPTIGKGQTGASLGQPGTPQSGAGSDASLSYWLRPTARDPLNGRESPRQRSAPPRLDVGVGRGAETAEGGAPSFPAVATRSQPVGAPTSTPGPANPRLTSQRLAVASSLIVGVASWYPARGDIAAVHSWRFGDDPYWANVCTFGSGAARCVSVYVSDYMANPRRAIDLSDDAFRQLAPLSVGVLRVTVEVPKVPETDR